MITLATLPQATAQEVFDQVSQHMLRQGARSKQAFNGCAYRGDGGLKCAAGCLISDEEYNSGMDNNPEGTGWVSLKERGEVPKEHFHLISRLQKLHDDEDLKVSDWPYELANLAKEYKLEFKAIGV
ncbi:hypothetical protein PHB09_139 [Pseudomonas phage PHB09]|uniref:Uncharacterized protein n=1 Tax=Pseudomonas phage PHB09 TaxID=2867265 RepID=A0AAE8XF72_9CAUD|nr:hypothetical protein QGX10_gp138 [Pseudomonas phage PHB09]UAV84634.1 hypothetical protein PHB09_139 [Pseudomonas phage PHB09]